MKLPRLVSALLLLALVLGMAGCGGGDSSPTPTPTQATVIPSPTATPAPTSEPTPTGTPLPTVAPTPTPTPMAQLQKPGSDDYVVQTLFSDPLAISADNPGPGGHTSLEACVDYCAANDCTECRDWIQSVYLSLDTGNQVDITGKFNGIWLPTINAIRDAVRQIPTLKEIGVNTVSFGPDVVTREVEAPRSVGDNLFRFYVRVFEDAGFNVHLVPNPMHWGHNDAYLADLQPVLLDWAAEAEAFDVAFYTTFNEVDGMNDSIEETSDWLQEILPQIKERYSGLVCVQPTQAGLTSQKLDFTGYDCLSSFFPLLVPDQTRNQRAISDFVAEAQRVKSGYASVKHVMFNDVATFSGGNWAETTIMEQQIRAQAEGRTEYSTEEQQADIFADFLDTAYPDIDGCFFNNWTGFTWVGKSAADVVKAVYSQQGMIPGKATDSVWATPGLLELIERVTLDDTERGLIFDLDTYVGGWAGLCFEPNPASPGPFGCTSTGECMECFRENPEEYWAWCLERCDGG